MPTPNGVNNLLQFLMISSNSPIIRLLESKVDVQSYVLLSFICPLDFQFCDYTFFWGNRILNGIRCKSNHFS